MPPLAESFTLSPPGRVLGTEVDQFVGEFVDASAPAGPPRPLAS